MANVNDIVSEASDYLDLTSRFYLADNTGAPTDTYGIIGKISHISEEITTFDIELKFDKNYTLGQANGYAMTSGDLNLSLEAVHTPILGKTNVFRVIADGIHAIRLNADFDTNAVFPADLDDKVLLPGTYVFECTYDVDGIRISVPKAANIVVQPPTILSAIVDNLTSDWVFNFNENVTNTTSAGWSLEINTVTTAINTVSGTGTNEIRMTSAATVAGGDTCTFSYNQLTGACVSIITGAELLDITDRELLNNVDTVDPIQGISDLAVYISAHDIDGDDTNNSAYSEGQVVITWGDKSGNSVDWTQANPTFQPTYHAELIPAVDSPYLQFSFAFLKYVAGISFETNKTFILLTQSAIGQKPIGTDGGDNFHWANSNDVNLTGDSFTESYTSVGYLNKVLFFVYDGTVIRYYINDSATEADSKTTAITDIPINKIGGDNEVTPTFSGQFGAFVVYNKILSQAERVIVYNTLQAKLGWPI